MRSAPGRKFALRCRDTHNAGEDRVIASRLGAAAAQLILEEKYGYMVGFKNREIIPIPLEEVAGKLKMVDPDSSIIREAKNLGISFGV